MVGRRAERRFARCAANQSVTRICGRWVRCFTTATRLAMPITAIESCIFRIAQERRCVRLHPIARRRNPKPSWRITPSHNLWRPERRRELEMRNRRIVHDIADRPGMAFGRAKSSVLAVAPARGSQPVRRSETPLEWSNVGELIIQLDGRRMLLRVALDEVSIKALFGAIAGHA